MATRTMDAPTAIPAFALVESPDECELVPVFEADTPLGEVADPVMDIPVTDVEEPEEVVDTGIEVAVKLRVL